MESLAPIFPIIFCQEELCHPLKLTSLDHLCGVGHGAEMTLLQTKKIEPLKVLTKPDLVRELKEVMGPSTSATSPI